MNRLTRQEQLKRGKLRFQENRIRSKIPTYKEAQESRRFKSSIRTKIATLLLSLGIATGYHGFKKDGITQVENHRTSVSDVTKEEAPKEVKRFIEEYSIKEEHNPHKALISSLFLKTLTEEEYQRNFDYFLNNVIRKIDKSQERRVIELNDIVNKIYKEGAPTRAVLDIKILLYLKIRKASRYKYTMHNEILKIIGKDKQLTNFQRTEYFLTLDTLYERELPIDREQIPGASTYSEELRTKYSGRVNQYRGRFIDFMISLSESELEELVDQIIRANYHKGEQRLNTTLGRLFKSEIGPPLAFRVPFPYDKKLKYWNRFNKIVK